MQEKKNPTMTPTKIHVVTVKDLPISCPTSHETLWNAHPRVFLPLDSEHPEMVCPYCDAVFKLQK